MADAKWNELMQQLEKCRRDYDALLPEENELRRQMDNLPDGPEKNALKKKYSAIVQKIKAADKLEKEAQKKLSSYQNKN